MGVNEFEMLRADFALMRSDIQSLKLDLVRLEAKIDEKPGYAALYQVAFGAPLALIGSSAAILGIAKALALI